MTDWSQLTHAYGSAENVPGLLDRLTTSPDEQSWDDLWSALCHQGSVYSASFAALPWLANIGDSPDRTRAVQAVLLAGAIVAAAKSSADTVRAQHAEPVARLLASANRYLPTASDRSEYVYLLECVLSLEGTAQWADDLAWGVVEEEFEIECPECAADLVVALGDTALVCTDENGESRPLRPAKPSDLGGIGRRLHDTAVAHGQPTTAQAFTRMFGHATCPSCRTDFVVADQALPR